MNSVTLDDKTLTNFIKTTELRKRTIKYKKYKFGDIKIVWS